MRIRNQPVQTPPGAGAGRCAVTVLELMISVTLISFIILALYQMFDRTQQQMRRAVRQVDILESGRTAIDLLQRDFAQMVASGTPLGVNFYTGTNYSSNALVMSSGADILLTNRLQDVFFLGLDSRSSPTNWMGVGYRVASATNPTVASATGVGTLYRFVTNANRFSTNFLVNFFTVPTNFYQRVADNVVHFRIVAVTNAVVLPLFNYLTNSDLPARLDLELGYVDSRTAERARGFEPNLMLVTNYLATNANNVQLFRVHIPIPARP